MLSALAKGSASWTGDVALESDGDHFDMKLDYPELRSPSRVLSSPRAKTPCRKKTILLNPNREVVLPKTYVTRKGALVLFTTPNQTEKTKQRRKPQKKLLQFRHSNDSKTIGSVPRLAQSVLNFGDGGNVNENRSISDPSNKAFFRFLHHLDEEFVNMHTQPGSNMKFYLQELRSKSARSRFSSALATSSRPVTSVSQSSYQSFDLSRDNTSLLDQDISVNIPGGNLPSSSAHSSRSQRLSVEKLTASLSRSASNLLSQPVTHDAIPDVSLETTSSYLNGTCNGGMWTCRESLTDGSGLNQYFEDESLKSPRSCFSASSHDSGARSTTISVKSKKERTTADTTRTALNEPVCGTTLMHVAPKHVSHDNIELNFDFDLVDAVDQVKVGVGEEDTGLDRLAEEIEDESQSQNELCTLGPTENNNSELRQPSVIQPLSPAYNDIMPYPDVPDPPVNSVRLEEHEASDFPAAFDTANDHISFVNRPHEASDELGSISKIEVVAMETPDQGKSSILLPENFEKSEVLQKEGEEDERPLREKEKSENQELESVQWDPQDETHSVAPPSSPTVPTASPDEDGLPRQHQWLVGENQTDVLDTSEVTSTVEGMEIEHLDKVESSETPTTFSQKVDNEKNSELENAKMANKETKSESTKLPSVKEETTADLRKFEANTKPKTSISTTVLSTNKNKASKLSAQSAKKATTSAILKQPTSTRSSSPRKAYTGALDISSLDTPTTAPKSSSILLLKKNHNDRLRNNFDDEEHGDESPISQTDDAPLPSPHSPPSPSPQKTKEELEVEKLSQEVNEIFEESKDSDEENDEGLTAEELELEKKILEQKMAAVQEKFLGTKVKEKKVKFTKNPTRTVKKKKKKELTEEEKLDLVKEREILRETRHKQKLKRIEEARKLEAEIKAQEEAKARHEMEADVMKHEIVNDLEMLAAQEREAKEAEEEARQLMAESRQTLREAREVRRKEEQERKREEAKRRRRQEKEAAEAARQREKEMLERIADAEERRRKQEEEEFRQEEAEEAEELRREEEERLLKLAMEEEEERYLEMERAAEEEALARLVADREEAQRRRWAVQEEARLLHEKKEQERRVFEEQQRQLEILQQKRAAEEEAKRGEAQQRLMQLKEEDAKAREDAMQQMEQRRELALQRRDQNVDRRHHLTSIKRSQGLTKPWVFSYYQPWPRETYEVSMGVGDSGKQRNTRRK